MSKIINTGLDQYRKVYFKSLNGIGSESVKVAAGPLRIYSHYQKWIRIAA